MRLHFFKVTAWDGEPQRLEDQDIKWQRVEAPDVSPMLPANAPVLAALALPSIMIVSNCAELGVDAWIQKVADLAIGEKLLVQVREKQCNFQQVQHILSRALARTGPFGARIVVNSDCGVFPQCNGVHLTAKALMAAIARPEAALVGASCHDEGELDHAEKIGVDYVVLGPVKATASHPGAAPLGCRDRWAHAGGPERGTAQRRARDRAARRGIFLTRSGVRGRFQ